MNAKAICEALKTVERPTGRVRLTEGDITATQRSVIVSMAQGAKLRSGPRYWLSTGFSAIVGRLTFYALLRKGLVIVDGRSHHKNTPRIYKLTAKGRRWALLEWNPRKHRSPAGW